MIKQAALVSLTLGALLSINASAKKLDMVCYSEHNGRSSRDFSIYEYPGNKKHNILLTGGFFEKVIPW